MWVYLDSSTGGKGQKSECTPREWVQKLAMATNAKLWRTTKVWLQWRLETIDLKQSSRFLPLHYVTYKAQNQRKRM